MLEKPDIQDELIIDCLQDNYGLSISQITFLPLGADAYAAVYRTVAADGVAYFVKLKWGNFDEIGVLLPKCLYDQGIRQVVAPLATVTGQLWVTIDSYKLILYPFKI